jgi:DNA-binding CsgD family transcriptional regulator
MSSTDEGFTVEDAIEMLTWAGYRITPTTLTSQIERTANVPTVPLTEKDPDRYYAVLDRVAEGATISDIMREFHMDYYTVKKYFPNSGRPDLAGGVGLDKSDPEKYRYIGQMVANGASLNEISRTTKTDHRTIKKYFPNAGWGKGGGGKAAEAREVNRKLRDLDGHGRVKKNRDAGFNLRGGR